MFKLLWIKNMKDMTVGNPVKLILFFSVPLILANICQQCYNLADTFVVGRYLGKAALAAVGGASGTLIFAIFGFFFGLSGGLAVITAQKFGAKDYAAVKKSIASSLVLCAAISLPPLLGAGFFARELLVLMNTPGDVIDNAEKYLQILFFLVVLNTGDPGGVTARHRGSDFVLHRIPVNIFHSSFPPKFQYSRIAASTAAR